MSKPFTGEVKRFIFLVCYLALLIGIFSGWAEKYITWLGQPVAPLEDLRLAGADVWLFMSVVLFVVGHIFRRGMELQAENDLTI